MKKSTEIVQPSPRNYGIDALRILSMLLVIVLHVLLQGGILHSPMMSERTEEIAWMLEAAAYCAVNCYALISGYVGYSSKNRFTPLILLWFTVTFYSVGVPLVLNRFFPDIAVTTTFHEYLHPVMYKVYWYFTAYFVVSLLAPFLNRMVKALDRKQAKYLLFLLFLLFSLMQTASPKDLFVLTEGYSALWLIVLYIIGACLKQHQFFSTLHAGYCFLLYLISVLSAWFSHQWLKDLNDYEAPWNKADVLIKYTSPFILMAAIFLFLFFAKLPRAPKPIAFVIKLLSPLSFGVYLLHTHPILWKEVLKNRFVDYATLEGGEFVLRVFSLAISIFLVCAAVDFVRYWLFRLLHLKKILTVAEDQLRERFS